MSDAMDRIAVAARLYRDAGALAAAVVVKATFALVERGPVALTTPLPIQMSDRFIKDDPRRSVRAAGDLAPRIAGAEVTFVGTAHAPTPVAARAVRLVVSRGQRTLVDKTLHVHGDRVPAPGEPPRPAPFTSMPIVYERAYGGPAFYDNPCGTGASADLSGETVPPNIVYPEAVRQALPAGFGPVAASVASRRRLLGPGAEAGFSGAVLEIDERTPTSYFNVAPPDQRLEILHGDERLTLVGLVPGVETFDTFLPRATASATATFHDRREQPIELSLDTAQIDGDARVVSLLYRGTLPIADEAALQGLRIVGALTLPDGARHERAAPSLPTKVPAPRLGARALGTVALGAPGTLTPDGKSTLPLGDTPASSDPPIPFPDSGARPRSERSGPIPGAPWAPDEAPSAVIPASKVQRTLFDGHEAAHVAPEAGPSAPRPAPDPPKASPGGEVWRQTPPESVAKDLPQPPASPPKRDVNALLYGKRKRR